MPSDDALIEVMSDPSLKRSDKIIGLLAALPQPSSVQAIRDKALAVGLSKASKWNISDILAGRKLHARRLKMGWQLTRAGWSRVQELGLQIRSPIVEGTARSLQAVVDGLSSKERREFLADALLCFDKGARKPAVVYSWVGAAWLMQQHVLAKALKQFNAAGIARFNKEQPNFVPIRTVESFGRLKEADLLVLMEDCGLISKSLHKQLKDRLDLRNAAGHPGTIEIDDHTAAAHIHFLVENVYKRF